MEVRRVIFNLFVNCSFSFYFRLGGALRLKSTLMEAVKFILMGSWVKLTVFTFASKMSFSLSLGWLVLLN